MRALALLDPVDNNRFTPEEPGYVSSLAALRQVTGAAPQVRPAARPAEPIASSVTPKGEPLREPTRAAESR